MYGFPSQTVLSKFNGKCLIAITLSANTISFSFDDNMSITCEKEFKLCNTNREPIDIYIPLENASISNLLQQSVSNIIKDTDMLLYIQFSNGSKLILEDDDKYESFHFKIGNKEIHV